LALSAIFALANAQCTVDGNTYSNGAQSITFGAAVGDFTPGLLDFGATETLSYGYWTFPTDSRWEITLVGSVTGQVCTDVGQYNAQFGGDCDTVLLNVISDSCSDRVALLGQTFTLVTRTPTAECVAAGSVLQTTLQPSLSLPALSGEAATIVFGSSGFAIISVGTRGALYERWVLSNTDAGETTNIVDLGSYGSGLACPSSRLGTYLSNYNADCQVQFCGISDGCISRGELLHGALFNGFQGAGACPRPVDNPGLIGYGACNPDADQWTKHPYDCRNQNIPGGCMFCMGRANGIEVSQCLDRNGAGCNDIFNSAARQAYCTFAFECPASTVTLSFLLFISSLVIMLLL